MNVLLINGSPHKEGCTYTALNEVAQTLNKEGIDTEIIHVGNKDIRGCIACRKCAETGKCVFNDIVNETAPKFAACDGIVIGSPVYYASANGTLISFLDRLFFSSHIDKSMKVGASVVSCRRAGNTATFDELNKYFTISSMPVVSSQFWKDSRPCAPLDGTWLSSLKALSLEKSSSAFRKKSRPSLPTLSTDTPMKFAGPQKGTGILYKAAMICVI